MLLQSASLRVWRKALRGQPPNESKVEDVENEANIQLMNAILSIKPEYVTEIIAGRKRFEFRKAVFARPVGKVYIYASAPVSKVVGEFQPVDVLKGAPHEVWKKTRRYSGIPQDWYDEYFNGCTTAYAIEIKNLQIYKEPKELPFRAPQSYRYIDNL